MGGKRAEPPYRIPINYSQAYVVMSLQPHIDITQTQILCVMCQETLIIQNEYAARHIN